MPPAAPAPARLLVVDDNELSRVMLSRRLRKRGYDVVAARDGREALAAVDAGGLDLVLLEIAMPGMSGFEIIEALKASGAGRVPVIVVSNVDETDSVVRCLKLGATDYLTKPINATVLKARIEASLALKRLRDEERAYTESLSRELEIGRRIQRGFLPETLPTAPGWDLAARFHPAREVAGDFYDAFAMPAAAPAAPADAVAPGSGRLALVVADVCDKGVGAALFMALFRSLIRATALAATDATEADRVLHVATRVNDYIATTHSAANMFATVFLGALDPATGRLVYVNGGHEAPVVVGPDGARTRLPPTGPALGLMPDLAFTAAETTLAPGSTLVAFTDGATDAQAPDGAFFTEERLLDLVAAPAPSAAAVLDRVVDALDAHTGDAPAFDDLTLLAVRAAG